jgi:hypothetical protein
VARRYRRRDDPNPRSSKPLARQVDPTTLSVAVRSIPVMSIPDGSRLRLPGNRRLLVSRSLAEAFTPPLCERTFTCPHPSVSGCSRICNLLA